MSLNTQVLNRPISKNLPYVEANLNYLIPMTEKPVYYTYEPPSGIPRQNGTFQTHKLPIYNARSISENISFGIRSHGINFGYTDNNLLMDKNKFNSLF